MWPHIDAGHTDEAKKEILSIFGKNKFPTPKPTRLIQRIPQIATDTDSIVLDSFAGSGTTGHAVLKQNAEDGGQRRFILVEMDGNIAENVTAERLRRICAGYGNARGQSVPGLGGGFQYCRLSREALFTPEGQIRKDVTFSQLAARLCEKIDTPWLVHDRKFAFVQHWLQVLAENMSLTQMARKKATIRNLIESRLEEIRRQWNEREGQKLLLSPWRPKSSGLTIFSPLIFWLRTIFQPRAMTRPNGAAISFITIFVQ